MVVGHERLRARHVVAPPPAERDAGVALRGSADGGRCGWVGCTSLGRVGRAPCWRWCCARSSRVPRTQRRPTARGVSVTGAARGAAAAEAARAHRRRAAELERDVRQRVVVHVEADVPPAASRWPPRHGVISARSRRDLGVISARSHRDGSVDSARASSTLPSFTAPPARSSNLSARAERESDARRARAAGGGRAAGGRCRTGCAVSSPRAMRRPLRARTRSRGSRRCSSTPAAERARRAGRRRARRPGGDARRPRGGATAGLRTSTDDALLIRSAPAGSACGVTRDCVGAWQRQHARQRQRAQQQALSGLRGHVAVGRARRAPRGVREGEAVEHVANQVVGLDDELEQRRERVRRRGVRLGRACGARIGEGLRVTGGPSGSCARGVSTWRRDLGVISA